MALAAVLTLHCGDAQVGQPDAGPDAGRVEAWEDAGPASDPDAGDPDGGAPDAGPIGGPYGTCEACTVSEECEPDAACIEVAGGASACVPGCDPAAPTCGASFGCEEFPGAAGPVCVPAGLLCCVDEDGDGYGQGLHCRGPDCSDGDRAVSPAAVEACNGLDDDCDGEVAPAELDADGDGFRGCDGDCNDDDPTVFPGAAEACNGRDDDCDGVISDEADGDADGVRVCAGDCDDADPLRYPGAPEQCNGLDDDCDGAVDPTELDGDGDGVRACAGDCDDTDPTRHPGAEETCNGVDDDCDGHIPAAESDSDGDLVRVCGGDCDDANPARAAGLPESCDLVDNDCDDEVDEGTTTCGLGVCARTVVDCVDGLSQLCLPLEAATPETCNGLDDDCDGEVDEGFGQESCGVGACARTIVLCDAGSDAVCVPGEPVEELCNTVDDDCDGVADEDNPGGGTDCTTGLRGVCGVGAMICAAGEVSCHVLVQPGGRVEACNGLDDDCDGDVDEGNPEAGQSCVSDQPGVCAAGTTRCGDGSLVCVPTLRASAETCDGNDNDCDGEVDDGLGVLTCGVGACVNETAACIEGVAQACEPLPAQAETCNGVDDDCDGVVDEGMSGLGTACDTGLEGICSTGIALCGPTQFVCTPTVRPGDQTEVCDGLDNDCDGDVDENDPGGGSACSTGRPGSCGAGTLHCTEGAVVCVSNTAPEAVDACNGLDDDCDGQVDEGIATLTCGRGICERTVPGCVGGVPQTCVPGQEGVEVCNGIDDNCDGSPDNGAPSAMCPAPGGVGATTCVAGECRIGSCSGRFRDADGTYTNGCECEDDSTSGAACGGSTHLGSLGGGGLVVSPIGTVPHASGGFEDWYSVSFPPNYTWGQKAPGKLRIGFALNEGGVYAIDVRENGCENPIACLDRRPYPVWDVEDTIAGSPLYPAGVANPCSGSQCGNPGSICGSSPSGYANPAPAGPCPWQNGGQGGEGRFGSRQKVWPSTVYVRVYRVDGGSGCQRYQLEISR